MRTLREISCIALAFLCIFLAVTTNGSFLIWSLCWTKTPSLTPMVGQNQSYSSCFLEGNICHSVILSLLQDREWQTGRISLEGGNKEEEGEKDWLLRSPQISVFVRWFNSSPCKIQWREKGRCQVIKLQCGQLWQPSP